MFKRPVIQFAAALIPTAFALLATLPGTAHAAIVTSSISVDRYGLSQLSAPENPGGDNEDIFLFTLQDAAGNPRTIAGLAPGAAAVFGLVEPGSSCSSPYWVGGTWNPGCSDVVCFINVGNQGQMWTFSDTPTPGDLTQTATPVPDACRSTAFLSSKQETNLGGKLDFLVYVNPVVFGAPTVPLFMHLESDTASGVTNLISDTVTVQTPAAPPIAFVVLALGFFVGLGFFAKRKGMGMGTPTA
jgi:hypothetical protein